MLRKSMEYVERGFRSAVPTLEPGYRKYTAFLWGSLALQCFCAGLLVIGVIDKAVWVEVIVPIQSAFIYGYFGASAIGKFSKGGGPPKIKK